MHTKRIAQEYNKRKQNRSPSSQRFQTYVSKKTDRDYISKDLECEILQDWVASDIYAKK